MVISLPNRFQDKSDEKELKEIISGYNSFFELFNEIKEMSLFEVYSDGSLKPEFNKGTNLFGYTPKDVEEGINVLELFDPEEHEKIIQRMSNVIADIKQEDREYTGIKKDGTKFPVLIYSKPVFKKDEVIGRRGVALDITELKKVQKKLKESQEHYQKLIELSPDGIALTKLDGQIVMVNKKGLELCGTEDESNIIGKKIFDFFLPEERDIVRNNIQELLEKEIITRYEKSVIKIDGTIFTAEISAGIIHNEERKPNYFISIFRDISSRKKAERLLQENEKKYRSLMQNLNVAVYRAHMYSYLNAKIVEVNPAFLEMFGYSSLDELLDIGRDKLFATHEERIRYNDTMIKYGKVTDLELSLRRKDGSIFNGSVSGVITEAEGKEYKIWDGIIEDITNRKIIEEKIIQSNKELIFKNEEMEKLTYTISHDLKTPLTSIQGFIQLITMENKDNLSEDTKFCLDRALKNTIHMGKVIDDILLYSQLGLITKEKNYHSLSEIINDVVLNLTPRLIEKRINIEIEDGLPSGYVNLKQFTQVFENLIDNAIKYMGDKDRRKIKIGKKEIKDDFGVIYVQDTGIGIMPEYFPKLFQLFSRIPNNLYDGAPGTGVGLANVKKIIETHGGDIWVESEYGKGTIFYIKIPLKEL